MLKQGDYTGHTVYGKNIKRGKHVGVKRLQIYSYISDYRVFVMNVDKPTEPVYVMGVWDLWHTWKEASPRKPRQKSKLTVYMTFNAVARECTKLVESLFR